MTAGRSPKLEKRTASELPVVSGSNVSDPVIERGSRIRPKLAACTLGQWILGSLRHLQLDRLRYLSANLIGLQQLNKTCSLCIPNDH